MATSDSAVIRVGATYTSVASQVPVNFAPSDYNLVPGAPGQYYTRQLIVTAPSVTIAGSVFTSIAVFLAKNIDGSNYVEVGYTYTDAAAVDHPNLVRLPPGGSMVISGPLKPSAGITFATALNPVAVELCIIGQ